MSYLTDAETVIKTLPPGSMIYGRVKQSLGTPWQTVFYIREDSEHIEAIPPNPPIEMRSGVMEERGVVLIPILIKLNDELYECWLNYCTQGGKEALQALASQEQNVVLIFKDKGKQERSIGFNNSCKNTFALILEGVSKKPTWQMKEFDAAKENLYRWFPKIKDLWRELK